MSRPIKETPILRGEDAKRFLEERAKASKVDPSVKERIFRNFKRLHEMFIKSQKP